MSAWGKKRFWKEAVAVPVEGGFEIHLDGRTLRTPAKTPVIVPSRAVAEAVAEEWGAQGEQILPMTMPTTRAVNAALDKVATQHAEVAELIAAYGASDLLCYRAEAPAALTARQAEAWDPLLDWARGAYGVDFALTSGVMPVAQPEATVARLAQEVHALDAFELTAVHDLVAMSGSLVIGLAAAAGHLPVETLWDLSRIDEQWQAEQWGRDEEAAQEAELKRSAFLHAKQFLDLYRAG